MVRPHALKSILLAAASLVAVNASAAPPTAPVAIAPIEHAADFDQAQPEARAPVIAVKHWLAGGAIAAALAGLIRLFGWSRMGAALAAAGKTAAAAPVVAVRYVGEAVKRPVRSMLLVLGLSLFALAGVGIYDVEWLAGMIAGGALAAAGFLGVRRIGRALERR
ncbi:MAG: hypothetical protein ACK4NP_05705 [Parvularculaceae bacterium]